MQEVLCRYLEVLCQRDKENLSLSCFCWVFSGTGLLFKRGTPCKLVNTRYQKHSSLVTSFKSAKKCLLTTPLDCLFYLLSICLVRSITMQPQKINYYKLKHTHTRFESNTSQRKNARISKGIFLMEDTHQVSLASSAFVAE